MPQSRPGSAREIALGRDPHFKILAAQTGAAHYRQWARRLITRRTVDSRFGRAFHQAVERATTIHFALDDIPDIGVAIAAGRRGFCPGNFTNAEFHYLMTNPHLLTKTVFYRKGVVAPTPTYADRTEENTP